MEHLAWSTSVNSRVNFHRNLIRCTITLYPANQQPLHCTILNYRNWAVWLCNSALYGGYSGILESERSAKTDPNVLSRIEHHMNIKVDKEKKHVEGQKRVFKACSFNSISTWRRLAFSTNVNRFDQNRLVWNKILPKTRMLSYSSKNLPFGITIIFLHEFQNFHWKEQTFHTLQKLSSRVITHAYPQFSSQSTKATLPLVRILSFAIYMQVIAYIISRASSMKENIFIKL